MPATTGRRSLYSRWAALGLTTRIVCGLLLGLALGLFFGEEMRRLQPAADGYIRLMQMTVLPYLVVALITGLGRLDPAVAWQLARVGGSALLLVWALSLLVLGLVPAAFPPRETGSFFSTSMLAPHAQLSLAEIYIPANPFASMSRSVVPAVTLFSLSIGVALMGVPGKERFLEPLEALLEALGRVTHFIVQLTPYGVVPVVAVAAGTLAPEDLGRLAIYFAGFILAALVLGLGLLPLAVATLTPFRYAEVMGAARDAMITAFVTSNVFIVLPMLAERCEELAERHGLDARAARSVPAIVVPIAFNFPTAGKLLTLLFVPFAGWLQGAPLAPADYPSWLANGLLSYFAKAQVALPFLLDLFELPADLFQLYLPTTVVNGKFDSAVGAISLLAFALLVTATLAGRLSLRPALLARNALLAVLALVAAVGAARFILGATLAAGPSRAEQLRALHMPRGLAQQEDPAALATTLDEPALSPLRERGTLRVGYQQERLPFSFRNADGQLVGFDIEMAEQLAQDLGLRLELVPTEPSRFGQDLRSGAVDLVASVRYTHHWIGRLRLSEPYLEATLGLLVRDAERDAFSDAASIRSGNGRLRVAIPGEADLYENYVRAFLGPRPYELVELPSWEAVFAARERFDIVVGLAEVAMAWALVHPEFSAVVPKDPLIRRPLAYALDVGREPLARVIDQWVLLQRARGRVDSAYDYWILGKGTETRVRRWSIAHDVLGWLD